RLAAARVSGGCSPSARNPEDKAMKSRYVMFAAYNRWANDRLYAVAAKLKNSDYHADRGAFFKSGSATLNHLLATDRIWMKRFTGTGTAPDRLDTILYDDLAGLRAARRDEDARIVQYVDGLTDADLAGVISYRTVAQPITVEQELGPALDHFFNHQTH